VSADSEPTPDPSSQGGISLDELAEAFAQVMGAARRLSPPEGAAAPTDALPGETTVPADDPSSAAARFSQEAADSFPQAEPEEEDTCGVTPQSILEAMLFVGDRENRPLEVSRAAALMRDVDPAEIAALVHQLNRRYESQGCPYQIVAEGDGYRLALRKSFSALRDRFFGRVREARLSQAAIDVLAIVAYQQPLTAEQIGALRGKPSAHILSQLVHRGLLRIERPPGPRQPGQYFSTDRFLHLFGLQSLADLPQGEELDR
jgi:segregation and condensation protein B